MLSPAGARQGGACATVRAERSIYCAERCSIGAGRPDARSEKSPRLPISTAARASPASVPHPWAASTSLLRPIRPALGRANADWSSPLLLSLVVAAVLAGTQMALGRDRVGAGLTPAPPTPPDVRIRIRRFA